MASVVGEASSSSSTPSPTSRSCTYHVFLSFRGEDTRTGFLGHLFAALDRKGITVFKDDRCLQKGEDISDELLKAIDESMFAITVLSPKYATSAWCLDELQRIVKRSKDQGLAIMPIFYDVEPSDVRYQIGSFEKPFKKHEGRFGQDSKKVRRWRKALTKVAGCSGWNNNDEEEAGLVESIAEYIHKKLIPKLPSCTKNLVGILSKVDDVSSFLGMGLNDVRFIGIWGMGGIGKTTIARAVYEAIQGDFKVSCFLARVREVCEKTNIVQIQKQLVAQVNISPDKVVNEYEGKKIIQNSLCNKKVLLVIDDVNEASQLDNLAGGKDWFGSGSRIIITTKDKHLLRTLETYEVKGLLKNEALKLFCLNAFKQGKPQEEYLDLSKEVVKYCGGLPLALEAWGSLLCGKTIEAWRASVKNMRSVRHSKILVKLKISYDDLDSMQKNIFLDIACFFKGMLRNYVIDILEGCGYNPQLDIEVLMERSLVSLSEEGELEMHDLFEELGKNLVIQESPNDAGKRSRLWFKEDIESVLSENKGTEAIQSIVLCGKISEGCCSDEAFSNMSQLKLLDIWGLKLPSSLNHLPLPSSLKVLRLVGYSSKTLPLANGQHKVVGNGKKSLENLKSLRLLDCDKLKQVPDLSTLPNLEKLDISFCGSLTKVHPSLIHHKNLVVLDLSGCRSLKTFPGKLKLSSLKELILFGCDGLESPPEFGKCMKRLVRLSLALTSISKLPTSLGCLVSLEELILTGCHNLVCLPDTIHELKFLRILEASGCKNLNRLPSSISQLSSLGSLDLSSCRLNGEEFPPDFCNFPALTELNLSGNHFVTIPIHIHKFPKLRNLRLKKCRDLQCLPELPSSIRELDARRCDSLKTSEFNPLSKACSVFASPSQDHGQVFQMLITGEEIPSWFVHQEDGNCVSIPLQHDFPQNERLGIALCFRIQSRAYSYYESGWCLDLCNGKRHVTKMITKIESGYSLYILYLSNDYFNNEIQLDNQFELLTSYPKNKLKILSSSACWMHKEDTKDLKKKRKRKSKRNK